MADKGDPPLPRMEKRERKRPSPKNLNVYSGWCKRCGICVAFCPKGALEVDSEGYPRWKEPLRCVGCRMCELRCPDFAIEVEMDEGGGDERER